MTNLKHILFFNQIGLDAINEVGGKNASLGEMYNQLKPMGIAIPNGFALTADAYRLFRKANNLEKKLNDSKSNPIECLVQSKECEYRFYVFIWRKA